MYLGSIGPNSQIHLYGTRILVVCNCHLFIHSQIKYRKLHDDRLTKNHLKTTKVSKIHQQRSQTEEKHNYIVTSTDTKPTNNEMSITTSKTKTNRSESVRSQIASRTNQILPITNIQEGKSEIPQGSGPPAPGRRWRRPIRRRIRRSSTG